MTGMTRGKKLKRVCKCCGDTFTAREADAKRGWALYCSKSCKAIRQMKTHGDTRISNYVDEFDGSWDAHKCGG